jgi:hypothetical protein
MEAHIGHQVDENMSSGMPEHEARRQAYLKLGGPRRVRAAGLAGFAPGRYAGPTHRVESMIEPEAAIEVVQPPPAVVETLWTSKQVLVDVSKHRGYNPPLIREAL